MHDVNYVRLPGLAAAFFGLAAAINIAIWVGTHRRGTLFTAAVLAVAAIAWIAVTMKRRREYLRR